MEQWHISAVMKLTQPTAILHELIPNGLCVQHEGLRNLLASVFLFHFLATTTSNIHQ